MSSTPPDVQSILARRMRVQREATLTADDIRELLGLPDDATVGANIGASAHLESLTLRWTDEGEPDQTQPRRRRRSKTTAPEPEPAVDPDGDGDGDGDTEPPPAPQATQPPAEDMP